MYISLHPTNAPNAWCSHHMYDTAATKDTVDHPLIINCGYRLNRGILNSSNFTFQLIASCPNVANRSLLFTCIRLHPLESLPISDEAEHIRRHMGLRTRITFNCLNTHSILIDLVESDDQTAATPPPPAHNFQYCRTYDSNERMSPHKCTNNVL